MALIPENNKNYLDTTYMHGYDVLSHIIYKRRGIGWQKNHEFYLACGPVRGSYGNYGDAFPVFHGLDEPCQTCGHQYMPTQQPVRIDPEGLLGGWFDGVQQNSAGMYWVPPRFYPDTYSDFRRESWFPQGDKLTPAVWQGVKIKLPTDSRTMLPRAMSFIRQSEWLYLAAHNLDSPFMPGEKKNGLFGAARVFHIQFGVTSETPKEWLDNIHGWNQRNDHIQIVPVILHRSTKLDI